MSIRSKRARSLNSAERRADAEAKAEAARRPARRIRALFFIGTLGLLTAVLGASLDPNHRFAGFMFGGLTGMIIGFALLAWPKDSDYPPDDLDRFWN